MLQKLYRHRDLKTTINYQANFIHKEAVQGHYHHLPPNPNRYVNKADILPGRVFCIRPINPLNIYRNYGLECLLVGFGRYSSQFEGRS